MSLLDQEGLPESEALESEFRHGMVALAVDAMRGAARFTAGEGRRGRWSG